MKEFFAEATGLMFLALVLAAALEMTQRPNTPAPSLNPLTTLTAPF